MDAQTSPIPDYMERVPGRMAPYEIALEEEEASTWRARSHPVIRDGVRVSATHYSAVVHELIILPVFEQISNTDRHAKTSSAYQSDRSSSHFPISLGLCLPKYYVATTASNPWIAVSTCE